MALSIKRQVRSVPQVGVPPYRQVHAHSTGNPNSTAQNEADYYSRKDPTLGTYTHVVGNGQIIQVSETNKGAWDVGGGWNYETYAAVELIESHKSKAEFLRDYKLYIDLLRQLAKEAGLPTTLDTGDKGIISHNYATYHQPSNNSDHVDPYPYLAKWGISKAQFAKDLANGFGGTTTNTTIGGDEMSFTFKVKGDKNWDEKAVYFYNGANNTIVKLGHPDQLKIINEMFKASTGRDLPRRDWTSKAPWYNRFIEATKAKRV